MVYKSASVPRVYNAIFFSFSLFEICKWREEFLMNFDNKLTFNYLIQCSSRLIYVSGFAKM